MELILILSGFPVLLLGKYIYDKDKNKESSQILTKLFIGGIGSTFITLILTEVINIIFPILSVDPTTLNLKELIFFVFIGIALIEEFSKWIVLYLIAYNNKEFDENYDGLIYASFVSLGFAFFENILYVLSGGISVAMIRAVSAVPLHACFGIIMGEFLVESKYGNKTINLIYSLVIPLLLHGIYDYSLISQMNILLLLDLIFVIILFKICYDKIKYYSK